MNSLRCLILLSTVFPLSILAAQDPVADLLFQPLFNGTNLAGWKVPEPNPFWIVNGGTLQGENDSGLKGNVLFTSKSYRDFVLELEVRWSGEIDSGVMLRAPELQLQLGVSRSLKKDMTGSFYTGKYPEPGQARNLSGTFKPNDWNRVRLEARGDSFKVWINDVKTTDYVDSKYDQPAPIGLQIHPGLKMRVEFRNVRIAELRAE